MISSPTARTNYAASIGLGGDERRGLGPPCFGCASRWNFCRCSAIDAFMSLGAETLHDMPQPLIPHVS